MYVAKRAFRNYGQVIVPGSTVEPGTIKRFNTLVGERRIIEVNEHNFKEWQEYFKVRLNIDLPAIKADEEHVEEEHVEEEHVEAKEVIKEAVKPVTATVKATVK